MENSQAYSILDYDGNFMDMIAELGTHVIMLDYRLTGEFVFKYANNKAVYAHLPVIAISCNSILTMNTISTVSTNMS
jgi:hypothetical protein